MTGSRHRIILGVFVGGVAGGILRFSHHVVLAQREDLPLWAGTLAANLLGCLLIGFFAEMTAPGSAWEWSPTLRQGCLAGFCGAYTTFSLFILETLLLWQQGKIWVAIGYASTTLLFSMGSAWLGLMLARSVQRPRI